ncbi:hypothetical protein CDD81_3396 [Ophiocordyceps australis]|uniref:tRNA (uracil-O(2)-)-methyltransferase n=1 Tax=Ophiocordyceps australis TaxID=1399860 RepID=A0A2C5XX71_9HYPO|nr:hypothetical protein CDD81_3396 [Ophiocordyceps australis]
MAFEPDELPPDSPCPFSDASGSHWVPLYRHDCGFDAGVFVDKMMNVIHNPNIHSSWLFRADILYDDSAETRQPLSRADARVQEIEAMALQRTLIRKLIPRLERRDKALDQTCTFYRSVSAEQVTLSLVLYIPHVSCPSQVPFYHPKVGGIAHVHQWDAARGCGFITICLLPFDSKDLDCQKTRRTAYHLLAKLYKHGQSSVKGGYVKRGNHDCVIAQARLQNRYASLKTKHARHLVDNWQESTDATKHVFEDLSIAAFLIELWADMYCHAKFPGFVDVGCGNGLLVYILTQEGYSGWGFDARCRKSWAQYQTKSLDRPSGQSLEQRLLLPSLALQDSLDSDTHEMQLDEIHNGIFPPGTFIISNHADQLTPWTPILGAMSRCPFIMIPCCSHNLTGAKYRAPRPRDKSKPKSTYASLVDWVAQIAEDCGWQMETEMLRIPSTRNTCLLGRTMMEGNSKRDFSAIVAKYGGAQGYYANVARLVKSAPKGH